MKAIPNNPIQDKASSSEVENTFTSSWPFSFLSFDQRGQCNFNANAKYAASSGSGHISFAFWIKGKKSIIGKKMILFEINTTNWLKSFSEKPVFFRSSFLCSSTSSSNNSGAKILSTGEKKKSAVCPEGEISAAINMLASTTTSIQKAEGCSFLNFSCIDFLTFLPNFKLNSSASFSESLDFPTIALNKASSVNFCRIAARATSDQFISLNSSISCFRSSGTDKVMVGMFDLPPFINAVNAFNTVYTQNIFKPFAG